MTLEKISLNLTWGRHSLTATGTPPFHVVPASKDEREQFCTCIIVGQENENALSFPDGIRLYFDFRHDADKVARFVNAR